MQYIVAPHYAPIHYPNASIFLGGGISNCPDWQTNTIKTLFSEIGSKPFTVVNPRRNAFDISKKEESSIQIVWEYNYLRLCNINFFWFPKETLCPITLFELGAALERRRNSSHLKLVVGVEPEYARRFDIEMQSELAGYEEPIYTTLEETITSLISKL